MNSSKEIHIFLRGGLGNQLFQYSTGLSISKRSGKKLVIREDLLPMVEDEIGRISRWPNQITSFNHSGEVRSRSFQPRSATNLFGKSMQAMRILGDVLPRICENFGLLTGESSNPRLPKNLAKVKLVNSYAPFKHLVWENRIQLRDQILDIKNPTKVFLDLKEEILENPPIVIHFRHGDYVNLGHIYGALQLPYFRQALNRVRTQKSKERVWIFSDSPTALSPELVNLLEPERILGPETLERAIENLVIMSMGTSFIASNSSFSWWTTILSSDEAKIVAPYIEAAQSNNFSKENEPRKNIDIIIS